MKITKKILLALTIAASAGSFSSVSLAEEGRTSFSPAVAIDNVGKKIDIAIAAIDAGKDKDAVSALIKDAKDESKEINASDKVSFSVNKARTEIKNAASEAKNGDLKTAGETLKKAKADFAALKSIL
jgi:hypothetical protein